MSRNKIKPFASWESATRDFSEILFIRVGLSQLSHPAMLSLRPTAFRVYIYMRLEARGKMIFEFPHSKYKNIVSKDGFQNAKAELIGKGFIQVRENNAHRMKANVYAFSEAWKYKS